MHQDGKIRYIKPHYCEFWESPLFYDVETLLLVSYFGVIQRSKNVSQTYIKDFGQIRPDKIDVIIDTIETIDKWYDDKIHHNIPQEEQKCRKHWL